MCAVRGTSEQWSLPETPESVLSICVYKFFVKVGVSLFPLGGIIPGQPNGCTFNLFYFTIIFYICLAKVARIIVPGIDLLGFSKHAPYRNSKVLVLADAPLILVLISVTCFLL